MRLAPTKFRGSVAILSLARIALTLFVAGLVLPVPGGRDPKAVTE